MLMGFLSALKSRFFQSEVCRVAKTGDVVAIAQCLARTSIVVVAADLGDSLPFDAPQDSVIAIIEAAMQKKSFGAIFKYEIDDEVFLPIFTDRAAAELFCGAYCDLLGHIHAFRLFKVPGDDICHWIHDGDILVLNPQGNNEVKIDRDKSEALRKRLPDAESLSNAQFVSLTLPMAGISRSIEFTPKK